MDTNREREWTRTGKADEMQIYADGVGRKSARRELPDEQERLYRHASPNLCVLA
jgi:hypothetical protein